MGIILSHANIAVDGEIDIIDLRLTPIYHHYKDADRLIIS